MQSTCGPTLPLAPSLYSYFILHIIYFFEYISPLELHCVPPYRFPNPFFKPDEGRNLVSEHINFYTVSNRQLAPFRFTQPCSQFSRWMLKKDVNVCCDKNQQNVRLDNIITKWCWVMLINADGFWSMLSDANAVTPSRNRSAQLRPWIITIFISVPSFSSTCR